MTQAPVICLGQQPCGFFPRRFLVAKFITARRLQSEIGGEIVYFCHDSDHDPRETQTILRHRNTGETAAMNFAFCGKVQRKHTPLYLKRIAEGWHASTLRQLPQYVRAEAVEAFRRTEAECVADFCLGMYANMGLLDGIRVVRSSDRKLRESACDIADFFVDVPFQGETVRARMIDGKLCLHEGGSCYVTVPSSDFTRAQVSPTRDSRLLWMQSAIRCTHYVCGAGEKAYLDTTQTPEITFVPRDPIDRSDEAWTDPAP